ncbi:MAG: UDP-3-O-acyl-N-acetylglucosamine deacetylase [Deltaproteobacteria bacterium]|nr:UDP-3-O-acyl-N-acetylglucosamine deacetylase [Deltaproteobacteria bacterium]
MQQTTIRFPVEFSGIGLHSGKENKMRIIPAPENSGILFKYKNSLIKAICHNSFSFPLCSALSDGKVRLFTVEHLLASLYALNIDNAIIELSEEEIPILDGSAIIFVQKILESGIRFFSTPRKRLIIRREIFCRHNDSYAIARPSDSLSIKYTIDFRSRLIGKQSYSVKLSPERFIEEIAPARTFCEFRDIEKMRDIGLIKGGSLENAIVVDDMRILNEKPLRFINEFVRHKILDAIGDIALIGNETAGEFEFYKAGHGLNNNLIKEILSNPLNYEIIETNTDEFEREQKLLMVFANLTEILTREK